MKKSDLRKQAHSQRLALTDAEFENINQLLLDQFKQLDLSGVRVLHIFLPIIEKREPDTFLLINWLKTCHPSIKILVPRADFASFKMSHHEYRGEKTLVKNAFNIQEPSNKDIHEGHIDMIIIPLLAFDLDGNRVGYGKGFYDRFLTEHPDAVKAGVSLFGPVKSIEEVNEMDIKLDLCITPLQTYHIRK